MFEEASIITCSYMALGQMVLAALQKTYISALTMLARTFIIHLKQEKQKSKHTKKFTHAARTQTLFTKCMNPNQSQNRAWFWVGTRGLADESGTKTVLTSERRMLLNTLKNIFNFNLLLLYLTHFLTS